MNIIQIIGLINSTLTGYRIVFGTAPTEHRAKEIIKSIIGDMPALSKDTNEVIDYCKEHYNF